jgi:hypothetical protein
MNGLDGGGMNSLFVSQLQFLASDHLAKGPRAPLKIRGHHLNIPVLELPKDVDAAATWNVRGNILHRMLLRALIL